MTLENKNVTVGPAPDTIATQLNVAYNTANAILGRALSILNTLKGLPPQEASGKNPVTPTVTASLSDINRVLFNTENFLIDIGNTIGNF